MENDTTYGSEELDIAIKDYQARGYWNCPNCGNGCEIDLPKCACDYVSPFAALGIV